MSLLGAGGGFWGEVEQAEAGEPHGESINQGQLERLLRPAVEDEITYKQIVCLKGGCSSVQCEDRSVEFSLEQAMSFTIDQMAHRVCKIEHLVERAQRQLEASDWHLLFEISFVTGGWVHTRRTLDKNEKFPATGIIIIPDY